VTARRFGLILLSLSLALLALQPAARAQARAGEDENVVETMRKARSYFEYGDYPNAALILNKLIETGRFESAELRTEAFRLLGLANFYQGKKGEAYRAFLELAYADPDAELDPFYVPPAAVALLAQVKKDAEQQLAPLRAQRHAEEEARRRAALEDEQRRRERAQVEEQRRFAAIAPVIERRVVQREFWVSLLPFGVGQFQNGDRGLGIGLAASEVVTGATSAGAALLIEELRDPATGKFGGSVYPMAQRLAVAKWIGAALFWGLWAAGALQAAWSFRPETPLPDRYVTQGAPLPPPELPEPLRAPVEAPPPAPVPAPATAPARAPAAAPALAPTSTPAARPAQPAGQPPPR
jgi:hypothetical protein